MNKPLIEKATFTFMIRFIQSKNADFDALINAMEKLSPVSTAIFSPVRIQ